MLVISNHVNTIGMEYSKDAVIRINIAWIESKEKLISLLYSLEGHKIWLDYPTGRTKPPQPKFSLEETINLLKSHKVDYFAFSNAEESSFIESIRQAVPKQIILVPKIETKKGVENLHQIIKAAQTNIIMLDKEDLYTDLATNQAHFEELVTQCRVECKKHNITCLELKGVVFGHESN